jgi:hypothetical protein
MIGFMVVVGGFALVVRACTGGTPQAGLAGGLIILLGALTATLELAQ